MDTPPQATHVIIAENNQLLSLFLRKVLSPASEKCFVFLQVDNAAEAVACFDHWTRIGVAIGGAILDYSLGDNTSEYVVSHYRKRRPDMPIILASVLADDLDLQGRMGRLGVSSFVDRPYAPKDVCQAFADHICPSSFWRLPGHTCFRQLSDQPGRGGPACHCVPRRTAGAYSLLGAPLASGQAA